MKASIKAGISARLKRVGATIVDYITSAVMLVRTNKCKFDMMENQNHWKASTGEHYTFGSIGKEEMERSK